MSKPFSRAEKDRMVRLYIEGADLRAVASTMGCSHELVRQTVMAAGFPIRPRPGTAAPTVSDVALELFSDLEDEFCGSCTEAEMREWLGLSAEDFSVASGELFRAGWITLMDGRIATVEAPRAHHVDLSERNSEILRRVADGETFASVAAALGVSIGTVAGVVGRSRRSTARSDTKEAAA
jgi:DNA-binding CsgD family transcriptional regulator